ncbi:helix-turn-helix domain-containing protein [Sphingomonas sp. UYP23]
MKPDPTEYRERLAAEAASIRDSGSLGRSEPLIRLFDFLLERSLAGRIPKEIEIAQEVFNKTTDFDMMLDASVRVYIHRLRRKLEEHYRAAPLAANRISIPLGEYHLVLAEPGIAVPEPAAVPDQPVIAAPEPRRTKRRAWIGVAVVALLAVNAAT